jgi:ABC-type multidrug transport system fused ATPase/permease subunit
MLLADVKGGIVPPGDVVMYIGLLLTLVGSLDAFHETIVNYYENCLECAGTLQSFLALRSAVSTDGTLSVPNSPTITFSDVSFKYPGFGEYILKNISFTLNSGEKLAIVGLNGAGKTTLIKLLTRLYDPTDGEILLNDIPLKEYRIEELHKLFGVVTQNSQIFDVSVRDNITLSENDDFVRLRKSCDIAGISDLKCDLDTLIGRSYSAEGYVPSGGERQKIAIARATYRDAGIIVLDEPSSALDAVAEDEILTRVSEFCEDKSIVLISHRLSAVRLVDRVLLLENGEILELGTHDELMRKGGRYSELYQMQAGEYTNRAQIREQINE